MRFGLLAGASAMALVLGAGAARATVFSYDGVVQNYVIPTTGEYRVIIAGASGGNSIHDDGGKGIVLGGDVDLKAGTKLAIVAAGKGGSSGDGGGGGGGSFLYVAGTSVLIAAAGGS